MLLYRAYDLVLESANALPELVPLATGAPDCTVIVVQQPTWPEPEAWYHTWHTPDGAIWLQFGRTTDGYVLRFPDLADFSVLADGRQVTSYARPGTPPDTLHHLLLNQVVPLVLQARGRLALHASAVSVAGGALAFVGMSGWGKSTLAAHSAVRGATLLSDDCLLLDEQPDQWRCVPSYGSVRLWADSVAQLGIAAGVSTVAHYSSKQRWDLATRTSSAAVPLRRLFFLTPPTQTPTAIEIVPLTPRDAYIELMSYAFTLDPLDQPRMAAQCAQLARLAGSTLCYRLGYPRAYAQLPAVLQAISAHVERTE